MTAAVLNRATGAKRDEFFTPLEAVERELPHYAEHLRGKRILCNCRDIDSEFSRFDWFKYNPHQVVYVGADRYIVSRAWGSTSYEVPYPQNLVPSSYKDAVGLELLKECDVVVTNPPFSKIRDFIKTVVKAGKDFVIVAPITAVLNIYVGNLLAEGKLRFGYTSVKEPFLLPDGSKQKFGNIVWFTSFPVDRHERKLTKTLASQNYQTYDNLPDVLFIDKCRNIPVDYDGIMAVPVSFLCSHNENQFEIVDGRTLHNSKYGICNGYDNTVNGKREFSRVFIRRRK